MDSSIRIRQKPIWQGGNDPRHKQSTSRFVLPTPTIRNGSYCNLSPTAQLHTYNPIHLRNSKWSSFFWTLYIHGPLYSEKLHVILQNLCLTPPPLIYQGVQVYHTPRKAEILTQHFERSHFLTLYMGTSHHTTTITRSVERFFRNTTPHISPLQLTNIYEVKRKILSLKLRSV